MKAINSGRSNASVDSLVPVSGRTSSVKWAEDEERDLVVMLAHRKGNKREVFDAFEDKVSLAISSVVLMSRTFFFF